MNQFTELKRSGDCYPYMGSVVALKADSRYYSGGCDKDAIRFGVVGRRIHDRGDGETGLEYDLFRKPSEIPSTQAVTTNMLKEYGKLYMRLATKEEIAFLSEQVRNDLLELDYKFDKKKVLDLLT